MSEPTYHEGGCHCGNVRYRITGDPDWSAHCHCTDCRLAIGAPFTSWIGVKAENFEVTKGEIAYRESSPENFRGYCKDCGTSLNMIAEKGWPGQVSLTAPSLDDPTIAHPTAHVWVSEQLPWVKLDDGLPRFDQF